jgi:hypothetical protein
MPLFQNFLCSRLSVHVEAPPPPSPEPLSPVDMSIIIEGGEDSFGSFEEVDEEMFEAME